MDNVIKFPDRFKGQNPVKSVEEVEELVDGMKAHHIHETLSLVLPMIFSRLEAAGFDFGIEEGDPDPFIKDGAFMVEALRAMMCKYHGLYHPFSDIAESIFVPDESDDDTLKVVESLSVKFRDTNAEEGQG